MHFVTQRKVKAMLNNWEKFLQFLNKLAYTIGQLVLLILAVLAVLLLLYGLNVIAFNIGGGVLGAVFFVATLLTLFGFLLQLMDEDSL